MSEVSASIIDFFLSCKNGTLANSCYAATNNYLGFIPKFKHAIFIIDFNRNFN